MMKKLGEPWKDIERIVQRVIADVIDEGDKIGAEKVEQIETKAVEELDNIRIESFHAGQANDDVWKRYNEQSLRLHCEETALRYFENLKSGTGNDIESTIRSIKLKIDKIEKDMMTDE